MDQLQSAASAAFNKLSASLIHCQIESADDETCTNLPKRTAHKKVNQQGASCETPPRANFTSRNWTAQYTLWLLQELTTKRCSSTHFLQR